MVVNFLHGNGMNYSIVATIIISKKFVNIGNKSCLFVCYKEQIDIELWMVEAVATLNASFSRMVEGKIRGKIW
jgi:hypothetical protein